MKKWIISIVSGLICNFSCYANTQTHFYPQSTHDLNLGSSATCLIKITNDSEQNIIVSGEFDDGSHLTPFIVYAYEVPQYISLFYFNICHGIMNIRIETERGLKLYDQDTYVNSKIRIKSGWLNPYIVLEKSHQS
jgi:hypothetical protein